jgi:NifU-like protein involved in Fe-S cluster formation
MNTALQEAINYEDLVREYNLSLNSVLRGFRPKYDFLELWVPDANHLRSVKNLVESALDQNHKTFSLYFSPAILKEIEWDKLVQELEKICKVEQKSEGGGKMLHLNPVKGAVKSSADEIDPLYREKILETYQSLAHQGSILEDGDNLLIRSNKEGISLFGAINTKDHTIHRARFSGTNKTVESALLEGLCAIIEGLPIQEAFDHGVLKLEYRLRDPKQKRPVAGIINVFNYPPMFELPLYLMRELYATYIKKTGYKPGDNFYVAPVGAEWKSKSEAEKAASIAHVFESLLQIPGRPYYRLPVKLHIISIDFHFKISFAIEGEIDPVTRSKLYMDLEVAVRKELEPRIEIYSQNVRDLNSIRRLNH